MRRGIQEWGNLICFSDLFNDVCVTNLGSELQPVSLLIDGQSIECQRLAYLIIDTMYLGSFWGEIGVALPIPHRESRTQRVGAFEGRAEAY